MEITGNTKGKIQEILHEKYQKYKMKNTGNTKWKIKEIQNGNTGNTKWKIQEIQN